MLIVSTVGPGVVPYFTDGRHPGRWSAGATRLFGLDGPVAATALRSVLEGCDPATGAYLPRVRPHRRRGGWDLVFGAPKSVSLLCASSGLALSRSVTEAHSAAVGGVVRFAEARLALQRSGPDGRPRRAEGLVAAAFDHRVNAATEPHLHTHVLVANLSRADGQWGPVGGDMWFVGRAALAALYQLELRHQLSRRGWALDWRLRPDGLADLADVPRAAVRAASTQSRMAVAGGRYAARQAARPQPWQERVAAAAGPGGGAAGPLDLTGRRATSEPPAPVLDDPALERAVAIRLAGRRSDFRAEDVIVALAACHAGGVAAEDAARWADDFCGRSRPVPSPTAGRRWTTEAARRSDNEVRRLLEGRAGDPLPASAVEELTAGRDDGAGEVVRSLTTSSAGVHFLASPAGRTDLLAQAEVLLTCREAWEQAGRRVAVVSPGPEAARRWQVLAGLVPYHPGDRVDVLVVDQADRRTSADLARLARGCGARLIFVEGGTLPRLTNPASHGLVGVGDDAGRLVCPPPRPWGPAPASGDLPGEGVAVGRAAAGQLLARCQASGMAPLLVGLGLEEVRELNRAARAMRIRAGAAGLGTDPGGLGTRPGGLGTEASRFVPGDRVVVLGRRVGLPGYGVFGTVSEVTSPAERRRSGLDIAWDDGTRTRTDDHRAIAAVGFGYAVTTAVAARTTGPVMVLGPASALGRGRDRALAETGLRPDRPGRERAAGLRPDG